MCEITTLAVIGGDARSLSLADAWVKSGRRAVTAALGPGSMSPAAALQTADAAVLPVPVTADGETLFAPLAADPVPLAVLFAAVPPTMRVFGGVTPRLAGPFRDRVEDLLAREELLVPNAALTAEGALQCMMEKTPFTVRGSRVLVVGFGRVGQALLRVLAPLGARVTVAARRPAALTLARTMDADTLPLSHLMGCGRFDVIFNTVPALLFDQKLLSRLDRQTLLIDLASKPGGVDWTAAKALGITAMAAPGLPGKIAPRTAGEVLYATLLNVMEEGGNPSCP